MQWLPVTMTMQVAVRSEAAKPGLYPVQLHTEVKLCTDDGCKKVAAPPVDVIVRIPEAQQESDDQGSSE